MYTLVHIEVSAPISSDVVVKFSIASNTCGEHGGE